jgi:exonuclease SbcD
VLNDQPHIRYSGSIECLDLGEKDDQKGVVIVEVGNQGLSAEPRFLPLPATPIEEIHIRDPESDLPRLEQTYPPEWRQRALVKLVIHYQAGHDILDDILEKAAQLFPRWYERDWKEVNALGQPWPLEESEVGQHQSVAQVVREYVERNLADQPEEERQALLQMVEEVLQECGEIPTAAATSPGIPSSFSSPGAAAMESEDEAEAGGFLWEESEGE